MKRLPAHWADGTAERIVRARTARGSNSDSDSNSNSDSDSSRRFICAAGITPSGTIHVGNLREVMTVDFVVRALQRSGHPVQFLFFWDDYDAFRKVPKNLAPSYPHLAEQLRKPLADIADPAETYPNYAQRNKEPFIQILKRLGIAPEYISQSEQYKHSQYAQWIKTAIQKRHAIRRLLNHYRTAPLPKDWWPITIYSTFTQKDTTTIVPPSSIAAAPTTASASASAPAAVSDGSHDESREWFVEYRCNETERSERLDLRTTPNVKLRWRTDWAMRWGYYRVDFEPAGKDHHTRGGSYDTARKIAKAKSIFNIAPPSTLTYGFIGIKGKGGAMASSTGEVISVDQLLAVYQPEVIRYLFASTRPIKEFSISFDIDVLKIYDDYDRCELQYFKSAHHKTSPAIEKNRRVYELSQVGAASPASSTLPTQIPFRHLCNLMQIGEGNIDIALRIYEKSTHIELSSEAKDTLAVRAACAWHWVTQYAPERFRFRLLSAEEAASPMQLDDATASALAAFRDRLHPRISETEIRSMIQEIVEAYNISAKALFKSLYTLLFAKPYGPQLSSFIMLAGVMRIQKILEKRLGESTISTPRP